MKFTIFEREEHFESHAEGDVIFAEGDFGDRMFAVQEGCVDLVVGDQRVETLEPGEIFGEVSLFDPGPREFTAWARTDCRVVPVDARRFKFLVQQTPSFALDVMQVMARRLRRTRTLQS